MARLPKPRRLTLAERDELDRVLAAVCLPTFTAREREIARRAARAALRAQPDSADAEPIRDGTIEAVRDDLKACQYELDRRIALLVPCMPYLQEGETPAEALVRNRKDIEAVLTLLAQEKRERRADLDAAVSAVKNLNRGASIRALESLVSAASVEPPARAPGTAREGPSDG